jgi:site-specific recombinase XerD
MSTTAITRATTAAELSGQATPYPEPSRAEPSPAEPSHPGSSHRPGSLCPGHAAGPLDQLSIQQVLAAMPNIPGWRTLDRATTGGRRLRGAAHVLSWLQTRPGDGWQQRWLAARADHGLGWINELAADDIGHTQHSRDELRAGINWLFLGRVIRPGYDFFLHYKTYTVFATAPQVISPDVFARVAQCGAASTIGPDERGRARVLLTKLVLHSGKRLDEITAEEFLEFRAWGSAVGHSPKGLHTAWDLLAAAGVLAPGSSLHAAARRGQPSIPGLVDFYNVRSPEIRRVLIRYLQERSPALDFNSMRSLAGHLVGRFWSDIERHHPGIDSLHLPEHIALEWKQRLMRVEGGTTSRPRKTWFDTLLRVRAFYLDIHEWALTDPSWARWAVPSPVRRGDTTGFVKARKQITAQMHQRIRERLPHRDLLVERTERHLAEQQALLAAASAAQVGASFDHDGRIFDRVRQRHGATDAVQVIERATAERTDLTRAEDEAFWSWAIIETLRHTGVRLEELLEITHLALVSYQLPGTGETVPLLQIVPSKSNEERLLLVSPELASVLATIITRLRGDNGGSVALVGRYDPHERLSGPPLPHLFQRRTGRRRAVIAYSTLRRLLNDAVARAGLADAAGEPMNYTAHDFRRMFVTEAVTAGLPVHIAARLLGHHTVSTTQSYLAVFQDDLIRAYRSFLDTRRASRPQQEYREPTPEEWREFQQHFALRKLELGSCGRPYGSPCQHEHACLRCPMLRIDPRQRTRLVEIIHNLDERITEARHNGWLGEVQGLRTSLDAARKKLVALDRTSGPRPSVADLGLPAITQPYPGRAVTLNQAAGIWPG